MPFFDIFASPRWSPLRMRTKMVSFFIFFQELSNKKKIKALRPKMTKIASRGGPALTFEFLFFQAGICPKTRWPSFTLQPTFVSWAASPSAEVDQLQCSLPVIRPCRSGNSDRRWGIEQFWKNVCSEISMKRNGNLQRTLSKLPFLFILIPSRLAFCFCIILPTVDRCSPGWKRNLLRCLRPRASLIASESEPLAYN